MQDNQTALMLAAAVNSTDGIRALMSHPGIDVNARDKVIQYVQLLITVH